MCPRNRLTRAGLLPGPGGEITHRSPVDRLDGSSTPRNRLGSALVRRDHRPLPMDTTATSTAATSPVLQVDPRIHNALWARFVAPVLDGSEGFVHHWTLAGVEDLGRLFPLGSIVTSSTSSH